jgi:hypothetical protein
VFTGAEQNVSPVHGSLVAAGTPTGCPTDSPADPRGNARSVAHRMPAAAAISGP